MQTKAPRSTFVFDSLNPSTDEEISNRIEEQIKRAVEQLVDKVSEERLRELLENRKESDWLQGGDVKGEADPEPITRQRIVEPLLDLLGFTDRLREVKGEAEDSQKALKADYSISLEDLNSISSSRLLIEAEPLGRNLDHSEHGLGQVRDWLEMRRFEADYGLATDGVRWILVKYDPDTHGTDVLVSVDLSPAFLYYLNQLQGQGQLGETHKEKVEEFVSAFERQNLLDVFREAPKVLASRKKELTKEFYDEYVKVVFGDPDDQDSTNLIQDGIIAPEDIETEHKQSFGVTLANRLIFVKFLEDKSLVNPGLLNRIVETYEDGYYSDTIYEKFIQTLFYDVLAKPPEKRPEEAEIELFNGLPYLNSDLFRPVLEGSQTDPINESVFDVENEELRELINLLEEYTFSANGRPGDLDPSIIGNVFEKTINKITLSSQGQKELGAYYTPDEITRFCAERTIPKALLEQFQEVLKDENGDYFYRIDWNEEKIDSYEDIYEFINDVPSVQSVEDTFLEVVNDFRVLDPACGSGHFLTSAINEIIRIRRAIHERKIEPSPQPFTLAKTTVRENIYGVDIMPQAVQIGKLRLWLSILEKGETVALHNKLENEDEEWLTLPNIGFNIRTGNSLIGYIGMEDEEGQSKITTWTEQTVRSRYSDVIQSITQYKSADGIEESVEARQEAEKKIAEHSDELNNLIRDDFREAGIEDIDSKGIAEYDPLHWVVEFAEVYAEGGFDTIIANPPWDRLTANRDTFFSRFDDRYDVGFRVLPPSEADHRVKELLEDPEIEQAWEDFQQQMEQRSTYFRNSGTYELQDPEVFDRKVGAEDDLSRLFLERAFELGRDDSQIAYVLPGNLWLGASAKDLRKHLLENTDFHTHAQFINKNIFDNVEDRKRICIMGFRNTGNTDTVYGAFEDGSTAILNNFEESSIPVEEEMLESFSPQSLVFPYIRSQDQIRIIEKIIENPIVSDPGEPWHLEPYRELDRTNDRDRFVESVEEGDYPVYGGKNIYQYVYDNAILDVEPPEFWSVADGSDKDARQRIRDKKKRELKNATYHDLDLSGSSMKGAVNDLLKKRRGEELQAEDVLLDCTSPRLVYRDIGRPTDERTMIAAVLPEGIVCHNKLHTVKRYTPNLNNRSQLESYPLHAIYETVQTVEEMFCALGLLNSLPFGYLMRSKIDSTIVMYKVKESQMPRLTDGDECFEFIWRRAARLNCYGEEFEELRDDLDIEPVEDGEERDEIRAEIDAAALHVYGLDEEEARFLVEDFYKTDDPTLMTPEYFEMVERKYEEIN